MSQEILEELLKSKELTAQRKFYSDHKDLSVKELRAAFKYQESLDHYDFDAVYILAELIAIKTGRFI